MRQRALNGVQNTYRGECEGQLACLLTYPPAFQHLTRAFYKAPNPVKITTNRNGASAAGLPPLQLELCCQSAFWGKCFEKARWTRGGNKKSTPSCTIRPGSAR